ncbi:MAG: cytochrome c oxidase assembly protein [Chloroflexi bacterium]|nr:cytochrome c oxidase assembly protein [Chloroflexota bacterium]
MMPLVWVWDGRTLLGLELLTGIYVLGVFRLWLHAGRGRGIPVWRAAAFAGCIAALVAALVSPLDRLAADSFAAHMTQHMILILIAAPLFVLSAYPVALFWAFPRHWANASAQHLRRFSGLWQFITQPLVAWVIFTATLWLWHVPRLYNAALQNDTLHFFEHGCFFAAAALFWWVLVRSAGRKQVQYGVNVLYLFTTALQSGALGALMTFASQPWYSTYTQNSNVFGLTALGDQQLAGLIMWLPGGVLFMLLAAAYFIAWLNAVERMMQNRLVRSS